MGVRGGKREGAGRKPVSDEIQTKHLCKTALLKKFGTLEKALEFLLDSNEPSLIKFVYEHYFGKPQDKVEHSGKVEMPQIQFNFPNGKD